MAGPIFNNAIPVFLLQFRGMTYKTDNPYEAIILGAGIGVIIIVALVVRMIRGPGTISSGKSSAATARKFNSFTFRRITSGYGLDKEQSKLLEFVFRNDGVYDPERSMKNPALLDKHFKKAYKTIEKSVESEQEAQLKQAQLFSLRNALDSAPENSNEIISTSQVPINTAAVLSTDKENYTVKVMSAKGDTLLTEMPRNALGSPAKLVKGAKITLSFFSKSSKGFAFDSKVLGSTETPQGPALSLQHSHKPKPLASRRFRRKQTHAGCVFYFVFTDTAKTSRKQAPKLIVDSRRFTGTILDISAGGCSIKTSAPVQVGSRLKIIIDYNEKESITVLGQALRTNHSGTVGTIICIKFLKVPRKSFNNINAVVFGYADQ